MARMYDFDKYNTICISVSSNSRYLEGYLRVANSQVAPGYLVKRWKPVAGDGTRYPVYGYPYENPDGPVIVVVENVYEGKSVHDNYLPGEKIYLRHLLPGDTFFGIAAVEIEEAERVAIGNTTGKIVVSTTVAASTSTCYPVIGYALQDAAIGDRVPIAVC